VQTGDNSKSAKESMRRGHHNTKYTRGCSTLSLIMDMSELGAESGHPESAGAHQVARFDLGRGNDGWLHLRRSISVVAKQ
jgi:hypothetical protein